MPKLLCFGRGSSSQFDPKLTSRAQACRRWLAIPSGISLAAAPSKLPTKAAIQRGIFHG